MAKGLLYAITVGVGEFFRGGEVTSITYDGNIKVIKVNEGGKLKEYKVDTKGKDSPGDAENFISRGWRATGRK